MPRRFVLLAVAALASGVVTAPAVSAAGNAQGLPPHSQRPVCGPPAAHAARCFAHVVTHQDSAAPLATVDYANGFTPDDLASAYQLPTLSTTGPTVAIVDAYNNPNAESDLAHYRSRFGLPDCTTANGCFTKVNQNGVQGSYPAGDTGWGAEIDLDLDMVSAACPTCHILLVEANSNNFTDLMTAASYAVQHAPFVSNSYGGPEFTSETSYDGIFHKTGVAVTVSSGDSGYGVQYPAASRYVTAVGGTSLTRDTNASRGWTETAWSGAGSGCSALETKPAWQKDTLCSRRTVADVSAVANPNTGVAVYDSYGSSGGANWFVYGGTSVAAPFVAAVWALGPSIGSTADTAGIPYALSNVGHWNDVTSGANTHRCRSGYLCQAVGGYDGPTGLGTPIGASGFGGTVGTGGGGGTTNTAPHAAFTWSCPTLTCDFTDASTDTEGNIASRVWDFGDSSPTSSATNPSHVYSGPGPWSVTLTVTDTGGLESTVNHSVTATAPSGGISLTASGRKQQGVEYVDLHWSGTTSAVDVYRGSTKIASAQPGPNYMDNTGHKGAATYTYQVCVDAGKTNCSNQATVVF